MKKLMRRMREEKGFTLAELLIVVAIIAVLVAIAIPIFSSQLEKSKEATDMANVRAAYATLVTKYIESPGAASVTVPAKQGQASWQTSGGGTLETMVDGSTNTVTYSAVLSGNNYTVAIDASGNVSVN